MRGDDWRFGDKSQREECLEFIGLVLLMWVVVGLLWAIPW